MKLNTNTYTIRLYRVANGPLSEAGHYVTHIDPDAGKPESERRLGDGYAEPLGEWILPNGVTVGETVSGEEGLFVGNNLYRPEFFRSKNSMVLQAAVDPSKKEEWIFLKRAKTSNIKKKIKTKTDTTATPEIIAEIDLGHAGEIILFSLGDGRKKYDVIRFDRPNGQILIGNQWIQGRSDSSLRQAHRGTTLRNAISGFLSHLPDRIGQHNSVDFYTADEETERIWTRAEVEELVRERVAGL